MKSESEFISGVYEKYERSLEIKRRRMKTFSVCATLSACACVAIFIAVKTVPVYENASADIAASADVADEEVYLYSSNGTASDAADIAEEAEIADEGAQISMSGAYADMFDKKAKAEDGATAANDDSVNISADAAEGAVSDAYGDRSADEVTDDSPVAMMFASPTALPENEDYEDNSAAIEDDSDSNSNVQVYKASQTVSESDCTEFSFSDGTVGFTVPADVPDSAYTVYVNESAGYDKLSEYTAESQARYGECGEGYYVYFSHDGDFAVIIFDSEYFDLEALRAVAESITYTEK